MMQQTQSNPEAGERLEQVAAGAARHVFMPLLSLADDSEAQVHSYYQQGRLFVLRHADDVALGITLAIPESADTVELKAVAVAPEQQGKGVGQRMMARVLAELRSAGVRRAIVGTGSCGIGQLAFYQKTGFRLWKIERDFFSRERGYPEGIEENGIPFATWSGWTRNSERLADQGPSKSRRGESGLT